MKSRSGKSGLKCEYCDKEFKFDSERKRHEQSHSPQFTCKVCSKKFSFVSALRRHEKQHERTGSVICNECNHKFRDESLLKRHIKYAHIGSYECPKCQVIFNSDLALRSHLKTHKPEAERRFRCSFDGCAKTFNFAHHLKHHELTHTNTKQHFCKECGKGFIQYHHLKSHMKTHEPESWILCTLPGCNKRFATVYALKRHIATHKNYHSDDDTSHHLKSIKDSSQLQEYENVGDGVTFDYKSLSDINELIESDIAPVEKSCSFSELKKERHVGDNTLNCIDNEQYNSTKIDLVKLNLDDDISTCKTYLDVCIMGEGDNSVGKCLCAQMTTVDDKLKQNKKDEISVSYNTKTAVVADDVKIGDCGGCECGSNFNKSSTGATKSELNINDALPQIVYETDGTIKIKEIFDVDIDIPYHCDTKGEVNTSDRIPFNSCKAVLGGCIVSGNGTIDEGCLCVRMVIDDQQLIDHEIDELMPRPL